MTDIGLYFTSKKFKKWGADSNSHFLIITLAYSETNRCWERYLHTFQQSLNKMGSNSYHWREYIMFTVNRYNSCPHCDTGHTPTVCHFTPQSVNNITLAQSVANVKKAAEGDKGK
jgi:hypothetical protein